MAKYLLEHRDGSLSEGIFDTDRDAEVWVRAVLDRAGWNLININNTPWHGCPGQALESSTQFSVCTPTDFGVENEVLCTLSRYC